MAAALVDGYTKVTDISTLAAGDKVVVYCDDSSTGVTGWNGSKDATVATTGWVEYVVEAATGGVYLKDVTAGKYIALTAKNSFAYDAKGSVCKVTATGVLVCTLSGTDYMLYQNGQYYRMYVDKTGNSGYKPFYVYKVLAAGTVTPAATVVTVENTTVSEMAQNLVLQGQWNEKSVTISLFPGATKGFGVYSGEGEGDFWGSIGTTDLFANGTDATYTDNGNGTFTFKAIMKDATNALYDITMNGLIPVQKTYTVAGSSDVAFGTAWDPTNTENDMTLMSGTVYSWMKEGLTLLAGDIMFKVCEDHAWTTAYPAQDYKLTIPETGIYTVMIMFDAASGVVDAFAEKTGDAVVIPTVAMHGNFAGPSNWADTENFTIAADNKTATLVLNLEATTDKPYEFGMRIGGKGNWTSNGVAFTRENASAVVVSGSGNLTLTADVTGEYTFTWTYETNTLAITFPAKEEPKPATWDEIVFTEVAAADVLNGAVFTSATNAAFTLTLVNDGKMVVDENTASFGTAEENGTYNFRLKTGGSTKSTRSLTLNVPADGKLRIAARSSSKDATDRAVVVKQNDVELCNQVVKDADKAGDYYPFVTVEVKKGITNVETVGAVNFYAFGFQAVAGPTVGFENIEATEKAVKFIENGQIFILRDGAVFNLMGARVK